MSGQKPSSDAVLAWHFLRNDGKLRDGRDAPPDGEWLVHDGPVIPCESGLHASENILDALHNAPGNIICRVELRGGIQEHGDPVDKLVGRERRILWRLNAETGERVLREYARWAALQVIDLWDAPDVMREYLVTGDESIRDAAYVASKPDYGGKYVEAQALSQDAALAAAYKFAWVGASCVRWAAGDGNWAAGRDAGAAKLTALVEAARVGQERTDA